MPIAPLRPSAAPRARAVAAPASPRAAAPSTGASVSYEHREASWKVWQKKTHRHTEQAKTITRLADTAANREKARALAAADGAQSVVVDLGSEIAVLSGGSLTTRGRSALTGFGGLTDGMTLTIDGQAATVLGTDTGLSEIDASQVIVAIVDTGVDVNHPALKGRLLPGYNALTGSDDVTDTEGHGTHVAGIIAADGADMQGVAPTAKILPVKVLGATSDPNGTIAKGIRYAVDHGARVINMSFFVRKTDVGYDEVIKALDYAASKGVVLIKSAGNTGAEGLTSPAEHPAIITVGALKQDAKRETRVRADYSSFGDRLDVAAPGDKILSLKPGGGYVGMSGTSMAAPHVAGLAALLIAQHPDWTPQQVRERLAGTADDVAAPGKDKYTGAGAVNAFKALFGR